MGMSFFKQLRREFAGYNGKKLSQDLMAGLTVAAVALPLALAFGVSAGATAACVPGSAGSAVKHESDLVPARPALSAAVRVLP